MIQDKIKDLIDKAPSSSGVYRFLGENSMVLYVGKAKNLRKRLLNYLAIERLSARIAHMMFLAHDLELVQTENELEALLLEHNLIKKLAPRYNILLRDDKTFALIALDKKHQFGGIRKHRGIKNNDSFYFGPFASGDDVTRVVDVLKKSFLLRSCSDSEFKSRTRPCLEHQIKKCSAPCVGLISQDDYAASINMAVDFLSGKSSQIQALLSDKMHKFSEALDFEKAAVVRNQIRSLSSIQAKQNVNLSDITDKDIINLVAQNDQFCIYVSFYRGGNNYGSKPYFYKAEEGLTATELLGKFLGQFYLNQEPPEELFLNLEIEDHDLMEDFLSKLSGKKVVVKIPQQGDKFKLVKDLEHIAKQVLQRKIEENFNEKELLLELKTLFNLSEIPQRIEVYDNSHISGKYAVGVLICAGPEGFIKSGYRKYNLDLEDLKNKDDTAMLREVLRRRFRSYKSDGGAVDADGSSAFDKNNNTFDVDNSNAFDKDKTSSGKNENISDATKISAEKDSNAPIMPDLIIIDGGLGQLSAAKNVFDELKINPPFICISKGPNRNAGEEYFHQINHESFTLPKTHKLMYYLQRLRDEAHRFAITTHRAKRGKSLTKSALDEVPNIGAKRKKALLNHFGSMDKIKSATVDDLMRVEGISLAIAKKIWGFFK